MPTPSHVLHPLHPLHPLASPTNFDPTRDNKTQHYRCRGLNDHYYDVDENYHGMLEHCRDVNDRFDDVTEYYRESDSEAHVTEPSNNLTKRIS